MNALLTLLYLLLCVGIVIFVPPLVIPYASDYGVFTAFDAAKAVLLCTALATVGRFLLLTSEKLTDLSCCGCLSPRCSCE